jgi:hypothetical protein
MMKPPKPRPTYIPVGEELLADLEAAERQSLEQAMERLEQLGLAIPEWIRREGSKE